MSESFEKEYHFPNPFESDINPVEDDEASPRSIPLASPDEIGMVLRMNEAQLEVLAASNGQRQSLLSKPFNSLKKIARKLTGEDVSIIDPERARFSQPDTVRLGPVSIIR